MNTEKPILDYSEVKRRSALDLSQTADVSRVQECAAGRIDAAIAEINNDLRARSAETNELIKRGLATVSKTMGMLACSQEAIARSRALLLDGPHEPAAQDRHRMSLILTIKRQERSARGQVQ